MRTTGIVSVTFRALSPDEIIELTRKAGLTGIEWGADIHVPFGELHNARMVGERTRDAGLRVLSYGSYYRAGQHVESFSEILQTAKALGAPHIRIWAGAKGSSETTSEERRSVTEDCRRIVQMAQDQGIAVSTEFHGGTLTDTPASALQLIEESGIHTYWQPNQFRDLAYNEGALRTVLPHVTGVHVFYWKGDTWLPLGEGQADWSVYRTILSARQDVPFMMEFVPGHSPKRFAKDAATLLSWVRADDDPSQNGQG